MNVRSGTLSWRRLLTAALAAAAIFVYWTQLSDRGARDLSRGSAVADSDRAGPLSGRADGAEVLETAPVSPAG